MKDLLVYLVGNIVSHPKDITLEEKEGWNQARTFVVHVNKEDMGVVIGKKGRIIRAIRDLVKLTAAKQNAYVDVVLAES